MISMSESFWMFSWSFRQIRLLVSLSIRPARRLRRQSILDNAERLFYEKGYFQTTIEDILERLSCSKGSFYYHFVSKREVLEALCRQRVVNSYEIYQKKHVGSMLAQLNMLLYHAHPLRVGEEDFLSMTLSLRLLEENSVISARMRLMLREVFMPELTRILVQLNEAGIIHYTQTKLPELIWESVISFFETISSCVCDNIKNRAVLAAQLGEIVNAERFIWERLLDAPFGSIEIIRLDEMLTVITRAAAHTAKRGEKEL